MYLWLFFGFLSPSMRVCLYRVRNAAAIYIQELCKKGDKDTWYSYTGRRCHPINMFKYNRCF